jgi:hypothetical protein
MRIIGWCLAVILAFALLLPSLLSTRLGPYFFSKFVPSTTVESLSLNWLSDQEAHGIVFKKDGVTAFVEKAVFKNPLWKALLTPSHPFSEIKLENGRIEAGGISLEQVNLNLKSEDGFKTFPFVLTGVSHSEKGEGKVNVKGLLSGPADHFRPLDLDVDLDSFPLATIDRLLPRPMLVDAFGPSLSLTGALHQGEITSFQIQGERIKGGGSPIQLNWVPAPTFFPGIESVQLTADLREMKWHALANLQEPLSFLGPAVTIDGLNNRFEVEAQNLEISPLVFDWGERISLEQPVRGKLFQLPFPYKALCPITFQIDSASLKNTLYSLAIKGHLEGCLEDQKSILPNFVIDFTKQDGAPFLFDGETTFTLKEEKIQKILGDGGKLAFTAQGYLLEENALELDPFAFHLVTPQLEGEGYFSLDNQGKIEVWQPITLYYHLTPQVAGEFFPQLPSLKRDAELLIEWTPTEPFYWDKLDSWHFQASLTTPSLPLEEFSLESLIGSLDLDGKEEKALITLKARSNDNTHLGGELSLDLLLTNWLKENNLSFEKAHHNFSLVLVNFPTAFLPEEAKEIFGSTVSLELDSKGEMEKAVGSVKVDSSSLKGRGSFGWDKEKLTLSTPGVEIDLSPAFFEPLLEPAKINLEIDNLVLPRNQPLLGTGKGHAEIMPTTLLGKNGERISLPAMEGQWNLGKEGLRFGMTAANGGFSLNALVSGTAPLPKRPTLRDFSLEFLLRGGNVPSSLLLAFPELSRVEPILAPSFSADIDLKFNKGEGTLSASLTSPKGTLVADGLFHEGWFFLNRPLEVSLQMTPEVADGILGELMPLVSTGVRGRSPIRISIDPKGFRLPIYPFDFNQVEIGQGIAELDQVEVYPTKELGDILSVIGAKSSPGKPEILWFTPLYFSLKGGIVSLKRVDLLISNRFPIAIWGKIDIPRDRVMLEIGLGAKTLELAFGMRGLPQDYILPLSLRGALDSAAIDKSKATAKVGALLAQIQGSPQGLLIGGVLDLLTGGFFEEGIPPPTTQPPWITETTPQKTQQQQQIQPEQEAPLKQLFKGIEKGAKNLLKKKNKKN